MSKVQIVPSVKGIDDKRVAEVLTLLHDSGVNATKVIFDTGLYCYFVQDNLPSCQFGRWLMANAPQRMWRLDAKGNPKASSSLSWQMAFTRKMIESCKTSIEKVLSQIPNSWEFGKNGKFLVLTGGIPKPLLQLHDECANKVEGKTAHQLFLEFKQADEDGKPKLGRRKGEGGNSKEALEKHRLLTEKEKINARRAKCEEFAAWLKAESDDAHLGDPEVEGSPEFADMVESINYFNGWQKNKAAGWQGGEA